MLVRVREVWCDARSRVSCVIAATVLSLVSTSALAQDTTGVGAISGVVVNAAGQPAAGVRVCALDTASCATSDAQGAFRIGELRAGSYRLEMLPLEGLPFTSEPVDVRAGLDGTVEITLPTVEGLEQTVTVTAPAFQAPEEVKNSGFLVGPREILKSAAALQDVSRYVQGLPGVVIGSNDFRNDIIVRGGSPLENLFVVDNVEIPNINAFANFASAGGTVSLLDAELLQDVTFLTGGYPAPYINRTSSVMQVTQREGNRKQFGGWATLGFAGAGAILEGPINAGKGSWVVSARRSFLDFFTDDVGFGGVPVNYSFNGKAVYDLSPAGPHLGGEHRGHRRDSAGPQSEIHRPRRRDRQLRHPLRRLAQRHGLQLAAYLRVARRGPARHHPFRGQGGPAGEGPGGAGRAAAGRATRGHHRAEPGGLLRGLARGRDHHQVRPHACTCRSSTRCRPVAASRRSASTTRRRSPYGNDTPYSPVPGIDPFFLDTELPLVPDRRLPAGVKAGGVARERHTGRALRPLRHPVAGSVQPARGRQGAPHQHAVVELERRVVLSAAGIPVRVGVSPERVARALARRPLRDGTGLVARAPTCG